ncbi:MAG: tetratricopeptide repeat protein, partial [Desulfococcaceae bacterium]
MLFCCLIFANAGYAVQRIPDFFEDMNSSKEDLVKILRTGDYQKAKETYENKLKDSPNDPALLLMLGYAEAGLKNWDKAVSSIEKGMHYLPADRKDDFLVDIGNIYNLKGDYTEAEKIYNNVLKKKPDDIRALHKMGRLYLKSGKNEKAVEIFEKIMRLDSS